MALMFVANQLYPDWDYAKGCLEFGSCFKGELIRNKAEARLSSTVRGMEYSTLINEIFVCKRGPYSHWSKDAWACRDCLTEFIRDNLPFWWLDRKRRG